MRLFTALACCLTLGVPAFAQAAPLYLVFAPSTTTNPQVMTLANSASPPGGGTAVLWTPVSGDMNTANYTLSGNTVIYTPPSPPAPNASVSSQLVNGTAGSFYWSEDVLSTGSKEIVAAFTNYTQSSTTLTFPIAFSTTTPYIIGNTLTGMSGVTLTKTGVTFAANNVNGTVLLKGY